MDLLLGNADDASRGADDGIVTTDVDEVYAGAEGPRDRGDV